MRNIIYYFGIMNGSDELDATEVWTIIIQKCKEEKLYLRLIS